MNYEFEQFDMQLQEEVINFIRYGEKHYLPGLAVECVIFGYHDHQLKVLLGKHLLHQGWAFPSAYIKREERLSDGAARILKERTSLENIFLQQFYTFGDSDYRVFKPSSESLADEIKEEFGEENWLYQRTLAIGYYALIDYSKAEVKAEFPFEKFEWYNISALPDLLFDHQEMMDKALATLRNQIHLQPIGYNLLPEKFTLPEIHVLYETILNKVLDRRNFPKKLLSLGILEKLDEKRKIGQHRSPFLYKFDKEAYEKALCEGLVLSF